MKWLLRFIGWATVFAVPSFLVSGPWQRALGAIAEHVVGWVGVHIEMTEVQIMAPFDLGIYLAMCLASRRAPPGVRRMALERGGLIMVGLEVVTVVASVLLYYAMGGGIHPNPRALRLTEYVIEFVPWASASTVWLAMLGAWELPLAAATGRGAGGLQGR